MRWMASRNASGCAKSGVMSLKRMPGLGKSGMSRMYFVRSIAEALRAAVDRYAYEVPISEATMPWTIRQAGPADAPVIVEFNRRLAEETEGKSLDPDVLAA